jgi:hypothetical protein
VINGEPVEFGTSGKLYNSNLVMYDRKTDTYWTQLDGLAIVGELTGMELKQLSMDTVGWGDWKAQHSEAEVLSQDTGFRRDYGFDPYGSYYTDSFLFSTVKERDDRVHPKTVVFGIEVDGESTAYIEDDLIEQGIIEDIIAGVSVRVERGADGSVTVTNTDTGEEIVKERGFWFAWYAFHPGTSLYGREPTTET